MSRFDTLGRRPSGPAGKCAVGLAAALAGLFLMGAATPTPKPEPTKDTRYGGMSREEWIAKINKEQQAREANYQAQRDEVRRKAEEAKKAAQRETTALKDQSPVALAMKNVAEIAVLYFDPSDTVVEEGGLCSTDVMVQCRKQRSFNVVDLVFSFDPTFVVPVAVHDDALRSQVVDKPLFATDLQAGRMRYSARLVRPVSFFAQRLLTVVWKGVKPCDSTVVRLETPEERSSVRLGAKDLLTDEMLPRGALLTLGMSVLPRDAGNVKRGFLPAGGDAAYAIPYFTKGPVWIDLTGPDQPVPAGQEFDVQIRLHNPDKTVFDTVSLLIRYPPDRVEVLDWDRGNWIRLGTNIHDAPAHATFPFDFHLADDVNAATGEIFYRMGMTHSQASDEGMLAELRARALAPASVHDFQLVRGDPNSLRTTDVSFLGVSLLEDASAASIVPASPTPIPAPPLSQTLGRGY